MCPDLDRELAKGSYCKGSSDDGVQYGMMTNVCLVAGGVPKGGESDDVATAATCRDASGGQPGSWPMGWVSAQCIGGSEEHIVGIKLAVAEMGSAVMDVGLVHNQTN